MKMKKYPLIILFTLYIFGGFVLDMFFREKVFSELENRYLQQAPPFSWKSLVDNSFSQKYEKYINDQFVGRDYWITLKSVSETALCKIENNGIVYGDGKQMFEKNLTLNQKRVDDNTKFIAEFKKQNPHSNINLMLIPSAYEVLTDKIPIGLGNVNQTEAIANVYKNIDSVNINTIDVTNRLKEHQQEYIYYLTDHHWTTLGAYYAYQQVCEKFNLIPQKIDDYKANTITNFYGTHFSKAKLFNAIPDNITWYDVPTENITIDDKQYDSMYDLEVSKERDKYAMFLRGNNGITIIQSPKSDDKKDNILIIKDSYANSFVPYLTTNYSTITVIDLRSISSKLSEIIAGKEYDDILIMYSFNNFSSDVNISKIAY